MLVVLDQSGNVLGPLVPKLVPVDPESLQVFVVFDRSDQVLDALWADLGVQDVAVGNTNRGPGPGPGSGLGPLPGTGTGGGVGVQGGFPNRTAQTAEHGAMVIARGALARSCVCARVRVGARVSTGPRRTPRSGRRPTAAEAAVAGSAAQRSQLFDDLVAFQRLGYNRGAFVAEVVVGKRHLFALCTTWTSGKASAHGGGARGTFRR